MKQLSELTFICQTLGTGGAETFNQDLLSALQKFKKVKVYAATNNRILAEMLSKDGIEVERIPVVIDIVGNWKGLVKAIFYLPFAVLFYSKLVYQARSTDLILMTGFPEKIIVTPIAKLLNIPVVWIEFGSLEPLFNKFFGLPKWLYSLVKNLPKKIIVPTHYTEQKITVEASLDPRKIEVIPCGRLFTQKHEIKINPFEVVCVSRMEEGKGQDLLIRSLPIVLKKYPRTKCILIGEGPFMLKLKSVVKELRLEKSVEFLGLVLDPLEYMAKANICLFPSVWALEGFGLVTIEAMSLGKPVVAFGCGPTLEIIEDQRNGLLADPGNVEDLAAQIVKIFSDKQLAQNLGKKAQKDFQQRYKMEDLVDQYYTVLSEALND